MLDTLKQRIICCIALIINKLHNEKKVEKSLFFFVRWGDNPPSEDMNCYQIRFSVGSIGRSIGRSVGHLVSHSI